MRKTMLALITVLFVSPAVIADDGGVQRYAVTITNITYNQRFTPLLVVTHKPSVQLFAVGEPASAELATIAESGDIGPMAALLEGMPDKVFDTENSGGLLFPGDSVTVYVNARGNFNRVSLVGMLIPTNDTFVALDSAYLSRWQRSYAVPAYDAGSEVNDESCANIPGPTCGGEGSSMADGEGFVHISRGIHGAGDLPSIDYDWRNPVAQVSVRRVRNDD